MRKIILYVAASVDGFIADKNGGVSWLQGDDSDLQAEGTYNRFIESVDTIILGYSTYHQIVTELSPDTWVYKGKKTYVLTHRSLEPVDEEIFFTNEDLKSLIKRLKAKEGKNIWICGGASIINQLIDLDLIDMYTITIVPTILGDGIPLFGKHRNELKLQMISTVNYNGFVETTYKKR